MSKKHRKASAKPDTPTAALECSAGEYFWLCNELNKARRALQASLFNGAKPEEKHIKVTEKVETSTTDKPASKPKPVKPTKVESKPAEVKPVEPKPVEEAPADKPAPKKRTRTKKAAEPKPATSESKPMTSASRKSPT